MVDISKIVPEGTLKPVSNPAPVKATETKNTAAIAAKTAESAKTANVAKTANKNKVKKVTPFQKYTHNVRETFSPLFGEEIDAVQITTKEAGHIYGSTTLLGPVVGSVAIASGAALTAAGIIGYVAGAFQDNDLNEISAERVLSGLKMMGTGVLMAATAIVTPITVAIQKLTGYDSWKGFSKSIDARKVTTRDELKNNPAYAPGDAVITITGNNLTIKPVETSAAPEKTVANNNSEKAQAKIYEILEKSQESFVAREAEKASETKARAI